MKKVLVSVLILASIIFIGFITQNQPFKFNQREVLSWQQIVDADTFIQVIPTNFHKLVKVVDPIIDGLQTVVGGKYMTEGIPVDMYLFYKRWLVDDNFLDDVLSTEKDSSFVDYANYSTDGFSINYSKGIKVINANCFKCHSGQINGQLIYGIGNVYSNYQKNKRIEAKLLTIYKTWLASDSNKAAMGNFNLHYENIAKYITTSNPIVNPAFRLEESCMQNLSPVDLSYKETPNFVINPNTVPSDTPPLWNIKYKDALYFNGMGRGSFEKLILQITIFGNPDTLSLRNSMVDCQKILNWASEIKPPKYPKTVDNNLVELGEKLYDKACVSCHGKLNKNNRIWDYKTLLVGLNHVKTDPFYALYFMGPSNLPQWYNSSWFAQSTPSSNLFPKLAYVAPPLSGVWATAPYLHNGSIPDLKSLLRSKDRPQFWKLMYDSPMNYNFDLVGLNYERHLSKSDLIVYDTTIPGYWNSGHTYSDDLSDEEIAGLLEYLKTL